MEIVGFDVEVVGMTVVVVGMIVIRKSKGLFVDTVIAVGSVEGIK
jgi:hypothetical protein